MKSIPTLSILLLITCLFFSSASAQKVKFKKGQILINDVHRGFIQTEKSFLTKTKFFFLDLNKDTVFAVGKQSIKSPIDTSDYNFTYDFLRVPKLNKLVYYPFKGKYWQSDNAILEHFLGLGVINTDLSINESKMIPFLDAQEPALPAGLVKLLENEKALMVDNDYIAPKIVRQNPAEAKMVSIQAVKVKSYKSTYNEFILSDSNFFIDEYTIQHTYSNQQTKEFESVELGKIVLKIPERYISHLESDPTGAKARETSKAEIFIYNVKGALVARIGPAPFGDLRVYSDNTKIGFMKHGMYEQTNIIERAKGFILALIQRKKM
jgi:hypothetical protein